MKNKNNETLNFCSKSTTRHGKFLPFYLMCNIMAYQIQRFDERRHRSNSPYTGGGAPFGRNIATILRSCNRRRLQCDCFLPTSPAPSTDNPNSPSILQPQPLRCPRRPPPRSTNRHERTENSLGRGLICLTYGRG